MSNFDKLKLIPNVSITGGTNKYGPIKVKKEKRNYGISGSYDVYDKKGTKVTLTGNYGKSSFKDKVKFKDKEFVSHSCAFLNGHLIIFHTHFTIFFAIVSSVTPTA